MAAGANEDELETLLFDAEIDAGLMEVLHSMQHHAGGMREAERICKDIAVKAVQAAFNKEDGTDTLPIWQLFTVMTLLARAVTARIVSASSDEDKSWRRAVIAGMLARSVMLESPNNDGRGTKR